MPGKSVKNWKMYHGLRRRGHSKTRAARITNAHVRRTKRRKKARKR